jgi:hypothetical protein
MENKEISYKKYLGLAAVIFAVVLVTSNFGVAFSQNNTDEFVNLNLTGGDVLTSPNSTETDASSNGTGSNSTNDP